jgi:hypothetical protein
LGEQCCILGSQRGNLGGMSFVNPLGDSLQILICVAFDIGDCFAKIIVTIAGDFRFEDRLQDSGM